MCQRDRETGDRVAPPATADDIRESYTRAVYRVDAGPAPIRLVVGERNPGLDRWLAERGALRFAFLSAANPGSVTLPDDENRLRHLRLVERLRECGLEAIAGESYEAATGGWREASLLVCGIEREAAVALAREFRQAALLVGEAGAAVELVFTAAAAD